MQALIQDQDVSLLAGLLAANSFDDQLDAIAEACPPGMDAVEWDERTHEVLSKAAQLLRLGASASESSAHQDGASGAQDFEPRCAMSALHGVELLVVHTSQQDLTLKVGTTIRLSRKALQNEYVLHVNLLTFCRVRC